VDSGVRRLINAGQTGPLHPGPEAREDEFGRDWEGTVVLAETVTGHPLSVRIARCRVVRRNDSANVRYVGLCGDDTIKAPRNQEVLVEPEGLPCVYMARIVATLESCVKRAQNTSGSEPPVFKKSPLSVSDKLE
jgi:hypothetical protein